MVFPPKKAGKGKPANAPVSAPPDIDTKAGKKSAPAKKAAPPKKGK